MTDTKLARVGKRDAVGAAPFIVEPREKIL